MKICRYLKDGKTGFGAVEQEEIKVIAGPERPNEQIGEVLSMSEIKLLSPAQPTKIIALGLNYRDHAREMGMPIPEQPIMFLKPPSSVIGPDEDITYPAGGITARVDYEAELGIVIGRKGKAVPKEKAMDYILGYTCVNDVTARDLQAKDGQWTRAKSFDTFCPIGPWIETELDTSNLSVKTELNGKTVQDSNTAELIFDVPAVVELISKVMTLLPGDVIATGTPPGVGPMNAGDTVVVSVEGIGALQNRVSTGK
ncbi:MAG: fumarylacetoacetate hydrolase family protein [bacterium]